MNYLNQQKYMASKDQSLLRQSKGPKGLQMGDQKRMKKIIIKRPNKKASKAPIVDLQKYKKPVKKQDTFMKMFSQGMSGNIKQRVAQTKLKYTSMTKNKSRQKLGHLTKGMTLQNKYKKQKIGMGLGQPDIYNQGWNTRMYGASKSQYQKFAHPKKGEPITYNPHLQKNASQGIQKYYINPNNTYYKGKLKKPPKINNHQNYSMQMPGANYTSKIKIKKKTRAESFTKKQAHAQEKYRKSHSQANIKQVPQYQPKNIKIKTPTKNNPNFTQKRKSATGPLTGSSTQWGTQYNFYMVKNKTQIGNMNLKNKSTSDRKRRERERAAKLKQQNQQQNQKKKINEIKQEAEMITKVIKKITLLGLKKKKNDKVTSQEAYEILYEMNGVFKYLIEKLGAIKNQETSFWVTPFQQIQKGFDIYHIFLHKQNKRLAEEKKVLEREVKHAAIPEDTKKLIKQLEKAEALNDLLPQDSITDQEENYKKGLKKDIPKSLRKKLKLNLDNLPTPKDDEYITFTETVSESQEQTNQEDSLNESEWDQILKDVMEKGYVIDKDGNKQELPPELKQKIQLLQVVEQQEEERNKTGGSFKKTKQYGSLEKI